MSLFDRLRDDRQLTGDTVAGFLVIQRPDL
jgi:hypothetical protein